MLQYRVFYVATVVTSCLLHHMHVLSVQLYKPILHDVRWQLSPAAHSHYMHIVVSGSVLTICPSCWLVSLPGSGQWEVVTSAVLPDTVRSALELRVQGEEDKQQQQQEGYYFDGFKRAVYLVEEVGGLQSHAWYHMV
jgi:hypothetical protein